MIGHTMPKDSFRYESNVVVYMFAQYLTRINNFRKRLLNNHYFSIKPCIYSMLRELVLDNLRLGN